MASGAKPAGALPCVAPMMTNRNSIVITTSIDQRRGQAVFAGRMVAVAIGGKAAGEIETRLAAGDHIQHAAPHDGADHLRDDVGNDLLGGKAAAGGKPDRDGRVEMAARDMADGVGHRHHGQPEGERHAEQADADLRENRRRSPRCRILRR